MVQRTSERLGVDSGGKTAVSMQGPGEVRPQDPRGVFDTQIANLQAPTLNAAPVAVTNQAQIDDPMVQAVLQIAPKIAEGFFKKGTEEAYLNGAALAGAGVAESELTVNPLTRAWATAGYKDTVGRMTVADYEASVIKDLSGWREKSPVEYSEYLAQKRAELLPKLSGMSREARGSIFSQLLTSERASIAKHTNEHSKFIVDTVGRSIQTSVGVMNTKLDMAQGDPEAYAAARDANFAHVMGNIYYNKNLPVEVRDKLMADQISYTLEKGHTELFKLFDAFPVVDAGDGTKVSALSTLPFDVQTKLHKQYSTAYNDQAASRNAGWWEQFAEINKQSVDPLAPKLSVDDYQKFLRLGLAQKAISPEKYASEIEQYSTKMAKVAREGVIANATSTGNLTALNIFSATPSEGVDALVNSLVRTGKSPLTVMNTLRDVGINTGNSAAFTKYGQMLAPAISSLMNNQTGQVSPDIANLITGYTASLDRAKTEGAVHFQSLVLSALPEEQRVFLSRLSANMSDRSLPIDQAIQNTRDAMLKDAALPPAARQERARQQAKENSDAAEALTSRQAFGWMWNGVKGAFGSQQATAEKALLPDTGPFGLFGVNETAAAEFEMQYRDEFLAEANSISLTQPSLPAEQRTEQALANIAARVIPAGGGALILPKGANASALFGVSLSADPIRIGAAIDSLIKPSTQGGKLKFSVRDGKFLYTEITEKGQTIPGGFLDPKDIGRVVEDKRKKEAEEHKKEFGPGEIFEQTYKAPDGTQVKAGVKYNGYNTAGIDNSWALKIRQSLVQKEGVRAHPYKDGQWADKSPKYSVGVGVNSGNPQYYPKPGPDGTVSFEAISTSFAGASDQAMRMAAGVASKVGLKNLDSYEMLTHLIYQNPGIATHRSQHPVYTPLLNAMAARDVDTAMKYLRQTPSYIGAKDPNNPAALSTRQKWYEDKLIKSLNQ